MWKPGMIFFAISTGLITKSITKMSIKISYKHIFNTVELG
jgi:hypothetical protein